MMKDLAQILKILKFRDHRTAFSVNQRVWNCSCPVWPGPWANLRPESPAEDNEHGDNVMNNNEHGDQISFEEDEGG